MSHQPWAIVTGASSGIGAELARSLATRQFNLVLSARRLDRLEALAAELRGAHRVEVEIVALDLALPASVDQLLARALRPGRHFQVLVNNAGIGVYGPADELPWPQVDGMLRLNVAALTELSMRLLPVLTASGRRAHILHVASIAALQPVPYFAAYAATKSYVRDFSYALRRELRGGPVSVTCLLPGGTWTEFADTAGLALSPMARRSMMTAAAVAEAGVAGMLAGRAEVVPGWLNKLIAWSTALGPRWLSAWAAERAMGGSAMRRLAARPERGSEAP